MPPVAPTAKIQFRQCGISRSTWSNIDPKAFQDMAHIVNTTCGPHVDHMWTSCSTWCRPWINPEHEPVYERSICLRWTHTDTGRKLQYLRWQNRVVGVQWSQTEMKISLSSLSDTAAHGAAPLELRCRGVRVRVKSSSLFQLKVNFLKHKNQKQKKITETRTREFKSSLDNFVSSTPF